jgi:hypothetical protein
MTDTYKSLPTLIREVREAAYEAGRADGIAHVASGETDPRTEAHRAYGEAIGAVVERLDSLGLR